MAGEYSKPPYSRTLGVPAAYNWQSLTGLRGAELEVHYYKNRNNSKETYDATTNPEG